MIFSQTRRIKFLSFLFAGLGIVFFWRLFYWQVIRAEDLTSIAKSQHFITKSIPAKRGSILASDNFPLVSSKESWLLWASPKVIKNPAGTAQKLAPLFLSEDKSAEATESAKSKEELLLEEEKRIKEILGKTENVWVPVKRKLTRDAKAKIEALGIDGIGFDPEEDRSYPEGTMAAHLLGFVGKDAAGQDKGYFGLEGYYDLSLSGASGKKAWEKDAFGKPILLGGLREISALDGANIKTHIDRTVQFIVERHLERGLEKYGASKGTVIVMRPTDGAVLAMASLPGYDPGRFTSFKEEEFSNPAVSESFEPGSIFKILVMAAAFDSGAVKKDDKCDICTGPRRVGEYTIKTWNDKYYPDSTPADIIKNSDNIGMIWTAEKLGKEKFYEYLKKFGLGKATGIDLQGEAVPPFVEKEGFIDLATASFGQGVALTPVQMVRAAAAIANKGFLLQPKVVDKLLTQAGEQDMPPGPRERVISERAAGEITEMMVNAVENGEAKWAKPRGFKIAGKTGTAQIPIAGHYDPEKTIASFVGFAPASEPRFVMLVSLREPKSSPWGSETAAPLWFSIARDLFPYLGIGPES